MLVEPSKSFVIFVKCSISALLKLILFLFSSLVMRITKNLWFITLLLSSPSENVYFFNIAHYCSFL